MVGISSFFKGAYAAQYASQLFSRGSQANMTASSGQPGQSFRNTDEPAYSGAAERALARIVDILSTSDEAADGKAGVSEAMGYITSAYGTSGEDKMTITGRAVYNAETGKGDDTLIVKSDAVSTVDTGDGDDSLNIAASFSADIEAGDGNDTVKIAADLALGISGGAGDDDIKISARTILGVDGGDGNDTLYLEGSHISASGGKGDDTVTLNSDGKGDVTYDFARGDGKDTLNVTSGISLRFTGVDGYTPDDAQISVGDGKLTITFAGSDDTLTVNFDQGALDGDTPQYAFEMDAGAYVLKIN
ncbi:RTX toxin [Rhizobium sp. PAMB 3174]